MIATVSGLERRAPVGRIAQRKPRFHRNVGARGANARPEGTVARTFITQIDRPMLFRAALAGAYDNWEEWY